MPEATIPQDIGAAETLAPSPDEIGDIGSAATRMMPAQAAPAGESRAAATGPRDSTPHTPLMSESGGQPSIDLAAIRGIRIGRYKIIGLIGAGGMGIVYAARDRELGRRVAIKVLRPELSTGERSAKTLIAEAKTMARLSHPNVCTVFEVGTTRDSVYLAMEYVDGHTLHDWLEHQPRSWQAVVQVLCDAGKGIQAAHSAGIIHRDLKPENIMIGRDGRVRVMDFGIATGSPVGGAVQQDDKPLSSLSSLVGTPSYMAPELLHGSKADESSDQFSLAVTLYEALYGVRPYQGKNIAELVLAYNDQQIHEPESRHGIPRWLRQVVLRGAAIDRDKRFPSIGAMVETLEKVPRVRRTWALAGVAGLILVFGVLLAVLLAQRSLAPGDPCVGSDEHLAEVWNDGRKAKLREALRASGISDPDEQWGRVVGAADEYGERWVTMRTQACRATRVLGEQSDDMLDRRMLCLEHRRAELNELVTVLESADRDAARRAAQAALSLEDLESCGARRELLDRPPAPEDPDRRAALTAVRARLNAAQIQFKLGRYAQVRDEATSVAEAAAEVGYAPVIAQARLLEGRVLANLDELEAGERAFTDAWLAAERGRDDRLKLAAQAEAMFLVGFEGARIEDARRWERHADATLARVGDAPRQEVILLRAKHGLAWRLRDPASHDSLTRLIELSERGYGPEHPLTARAYSDRSTNLAARGEMDGMLADSRRARQIIEKALGKRHPMAAEIDNNLGNAYYRTEQLEQASVHYQRALEVWESFFGPEHSRVAVALTNLGNVRLAEEKVAEAIELYRRALRIEEALYGRDHDKSVATMLNLGTAYMLDLEDDKAVAILERARAIVGTSRHGEAAAIHFALARALQGGDEKRALAMARAARGIYRELAGHEGELREVDEWIGDRARML